MEDGSSLRDKIRGSYHKRQIVEEAATLSARGRKLKTQPDIWKDLFLD